MDRFQRRFDGNPLRDPADSLAVLRLDQPGDKNMESLATPTSWVSAQQRLETVSRPNRELHRQDTLRRQPQRVRGVHRVAEELDGTVPRGTLTSGPGLKGRGEGDEKRQGRQKPT